jgi:hypothetical protein
MTTWILHCEGASLGGEDSGEDGVSEYIEAETAAAVRSTRFDVRAVSDELAGSPERVDEPGGQVRRALVFVGGG